jgi:Prokaryotic E2 family E
MVPEQLLSEVEVLKQDGIDVDLVECEGMINLVLHGWPIPPTMNKAKSDILLRIPLGYPGAKPDMFWTDEDLKLRDGNVPRSAEAIETIAGRHWRRFSWHTQNWNPGVDNLQVYMEFVSVRLGKAE